MTGGDRVHDHHLLHEVSRITDDYGALHRRTVRELAQSRAALAEAHQVLRAVSHDLRTPLAAVIGFTELLLDDELSPAQRELAERVMRAARAMTSLTGELVEAVALGAAPVRFDPVNLALVARHVVTRHQMLASPRGVRVVLDKDPSKDAPTVVRGDEAKLERVVENLVSNAVKFSPDGGEVRVVLSEDANGVEIRVRDEGPGIAADEMEDIFVPFHRAPGAATVPGVGLGLTIVKRITEHHGGRVHVESAPGAGATFVVRLPSTDEGVVDGSG
ncbi:HAMP domain-containing sensor histidine kinase [Nocardioides aquiterrae]|uniref:histidine kinase n=1 Tax=Nocardioides aquiterrae TaxID=203799 RepID=A0ABP4ETV9_9ACTN